MINFKIHIVKMTMLKSGKVVNLFYEKKSRLFLGFGFETDPVPLHIMLESVQPYFPPNFEAIGRFQVNHSDRVKYDVVVDHIQGDVYNFTQQALKL